MKTAIIAALAAAALAQSGGGAAGDTNGKNEPAAKPAPVIPIELQAEYYRADGVLAHLQGELAKANADYEAAVKAILKACGEGFVAAPTDDKKHLYCAVQPAPPAAAKK